MDLIKRQTEFTIAELLELLDTDCHGYPDCLLINEIGAACQAGEDFDGAGERFLLKTLNAPLDYQRAIAYCLLSVIDVERNRYDLELQSFRDNPKNQHLKPKIARMMAAFSES